VGQSVRRYDIQALRPDDGVQCTEHIVIAVQRL
jgi:hypothetical protein